MVAVKDCLFCNKSFFTKENVIYENKYWIAVYDGFPVIKGHTLLIPKSHVSNMFELNFNAYISLFFMIKNLKKILDEKFKPSGYNLGINNGRCSGQTINHLHIHLIPRYDNDGGLPCGVRNVFPTEKANYTNKIKD